MVKLSWFIFALVVGFVYFGVRVFSPQTIEFGYDQPKLLTAVAEMVRDKDFINAQAYVDVNSYKSHTYGPLLLYLLSPFVLITHDPIVLSYGMVLFNSLAILMVFVIGRKLFDDKVGAVAAVLLSVNPWHIIFSRMVYQPSPLPVFVALIFYGVLIIGEKNSHFWLFFLPIILAVAIQIHIIVLPIAFITVWLVVKYGYLKNFYFVVGTIFASFLFLPIFWYDSTHGYTWVKSFFLGMGLLNYKLFFLKSYEVFRQFFLISSSGGLNWQLGYAFSDFFEQNKKVILTLEAVLLFLNAGGGFFAYYYKPIFKKMQFLLLYIISIPIFLIFFPLADVLPRYFYPLTPLFAVLWAVVLVKVARQFGRHKNVFLGISVLVVGSLSLILTREYFSFVSIFDYPRGFLSHFSDVPYSFTHDAMNFASVSARDGEHCTLSISSDSENPKGHNLNWAQFYVWNFTKFDRGPWCDRPDTAYFLIHFLPIPDTIEVESYTRFGPYAVYAYP